MTLFITRRSRRWVLYPLLCLLVLCLAVGCTQASDTPDGTEAPTGTEAPATDAPTDTDTEPASESDTAPISETDPVTDPVTETETETQPITESETETQPITELVTETETETEPVTETETETETETGWSPDMGIFNEGKVQYEKGEDGMIKATPTEGYTLGLDITDKTDLVSICYTTWFDAIFDEDDTMYNISEIEAGRQDWGPVNYFHYWGEPAEGYYSSSDKNVIRKHMTQLYAAGVDFIIIDATFLGDHSIANGWWESYTAGPTRAICDTIMEMRAEGLGTPYVVFWLGTNKAGKLFKQAYDDFFSQEKWKDCFVYWDNKPFVITWGNVEDCPYLDTITVRTMRGLQYNAPASEWSFLTLNTWGKYAVGPDGKPEQVTVSVASQQTYMSLPSAEGRQGGSRWFKQWYNAFAIHPKIVTLTWWNEWTAQRLPVDGGYQFTDNYNQEYSRDIEPMAGGHGDQYYQWLIQYISAYKGGLDCPILVEDDYIRIVNRWLKNLK